MKSYLREKHEKKGRVYLGIPHRLDRGATGLVLFAKQSKSARRLAEQFAQRTVQKTYWALVEGIVEPERGTWEDWLVRDENQARAERASASAPGAKLAVLNYHRLAQSEHWSLLELELVTGRYHQARVQAALRGAPIVGDFLYGAQLPFGEPTSEARQQIFALHARSLTFLHPIRYEPITLVAPLSTHWWQTVGEGALLALGLSLQ